jgi:hypothetical protein
VAYNSNGEQEFPAREGEPLAQDPVWGHESRMPPKQVLVDNRWSDPKDDRRQAVSRFGRRHDDINADNLITKKLVVVTVVIVDVLYLACDVLFVQFHNCN